MTDDGPQYPMDPYDVFLERVGRFDLHCSSEDDALYVRTLPREGLRYDFDILEFTTHPDGIATWDESQFPMDTDPTPAEICDIIAACARYGYRAPTDTETDT